jgi:hypothetical protein
MNGSDAANVACAGANAPLGIPDMLRLAATPSFAAMALLSALGGNAMPDLCAPRLGSPLSGMALMYAMMSAFHAPAWLQLMCDRRARGITKIRGRRADDSSAAQL